MKGESNDSPVIPEKAEKTRYPQPPFRKAVAEKRKEKKDSEKGNKERLRKRKQRKTQKKETKKDSKRH